MALQTFINTLIENVPEKHLPKKIDLVFYYKKNNLTVLRHCFTPGTGRACYSFLPSVRFTRKISPPNATMGRIMPL